MVIIEAKQSAARHVPSVITASTQKQTSAVIARQTAASNGSDERLTLLELPLHALHLRFVATYAVQTLRVQA